MVLSGSVIIVHSHSLKKLSYTYVYNMYVGTIILMLYLGYNECGV